MNLLAPVHQLADVALAINVPCVSLSVSRRDKLDPSGGRVVIEKLTKAFDRWRIALGKNCPRVRLDLERHFPLWIMVESIEHVLQ